MTWWWAHLLAERVSAPPLADEKSGAFLRMIHWEALAFSVIHIVLGVLALWAIVREWQAHRRAEIFFAALTHEFKTPLATALLGAEVLHGLLPKWGDSATRSRFDRGIRRIREDLVRLDAQVEKGLELVRLDRPREGLGEPQSLESWLSREVPRLARNHLDEELSKLTIDCVPGNVHFDANALRIVFRNLIENAKRHSGLENPKIEICGVAHEKFIELSVWNEGQSPQLEFAVLGKLYHRGSQSTGTGVGLYLVRSLCERMGVRVQFATNQNQSSGGFTVRLLFARES